MLPLGKIQLGIVRSWLWFKERVQNRKAEPWLAVLSFAESFFIPIPVDPFLAAMVVADRARWIRTATIATLTSTLGALAGYAIGYFAFDLIGAWFAHVADRSAFIEKMAVVFTDNAEALTFAAALTPIPNAPVVIAAGFFSAPLVWFALAWFSARAIRFFGVAYIAYAFGLTTVSRFERVLSIGTVALALIVLSVVAYAVADTSAL